MAKTTSDSLLGVIHSMFG